MPLNERTASKVFDSKDNFSGVTSWISSIAKPSEKSPKVTFVFFGV